MISPHRTIGCGVVAVLLLACTGTSSATSSTAGPETTLSTTSSSLPTTTTTSVLPGFDVLAFHRTEGFRHASIEAGIAALETLGEEHGFTLVASDDPAVFSESGLGEFEVIVFLSTTGDVLDSDGEKAMEGFVEGGGGFVGVHAAADTE